MATVLVADGTERSALAVVRSLGRAGHRVIVAAARPRPLAAASRWCAAEVTVSDALTTPAEFAAQLAGAAGTHGAEVVLPVTDGSVLAVLGHAADFGASCLPFGSLDAFAGLSDKSAAAAAAAGLGIRVPRQIELAQRATAEALGAMAPPLILKPARSVAGAVGARAKHSVVHVANRAELERALRHLPDTAFPLLAQERIVGAGVGVFLLVWNGRLLAAFAHRRIREKPPSGGVSVYAESVALEAGLLKRSRALVDSLGWNGVAMVEYKIDGRTGEPALMEINGRFWGSLQLAIDAGVDFPRLLLDAALGREVAPVLEWHHGVRSRWFWGDMDHALARLRRSAAELHLPPGAPSRVATLAGEIATTLRFPNDQVYSLGDPGPGLRELAQRLSLSPS